MPMGDGEKSKERGDAQNVTKNFMDSVRYSEKKSELPKTCGSYGKGKKK